MGGNAMLGAKLKAARKAAHKTAAEAGKVTGVKQNAVYKWESGDSEPNASQLLTLCRLYGIELSDLYDSQPKVLREFANPWEADVDLRLECADIMREHPDAYPVIVKDEFTDKALPCGSYALIEPISGAIEDGTLCAVSIDGAYPIFARVHKLHAGLKLEPDSLDPTKREKIIDFTKGDDASVLGAVIWFFPPYAKAD